MVERGDYAGAAHNMLQSKWARQVGRRATRLAAMMRTGG
jgi:lysozyme